MEGMGIYSKIINFINNQVSIVLSAGSVIIKNIIRLKLNTCIQF